jgi:Fe2+ transport system protein FeoA
MKKTLAALEPGDCAVVEGFTAIDALSQRLMQLGILEGTPVEMVRRAPTGDPIEIRVLGYALSLRLAEAETILISDIC